MAPPALADRDETGVGAQLQSGVYKEPLPGTVISVILTMVSLTILSSFITQRSLAIKVWSRLPYVVWLVFAIYGDSFLFVFATAILQFGMGVDSALSICEAAILLCLVCYVTTKFIYLFLVEKVYIIKGSTKKRMKSKLYLFNSFGMIGVYIVVAILNFIFRFTKMENGQCIIGMRRAAMIPLISFDTVVNVYLTVLFIIPLSGLYSFKHFQRTPANIRLRTIAIRTFIGSICTLLSSIVNLSVLMALDGEPGWVCLMCCNSDILFSAIVLQWITSKDNAASGSRSDQSAFANESKLRSGAPGPHGSSTANNGNGNGDNDHSASLSPKQSPSTKPVMEDIAEISLDNVHRYSSSEDVSSAVPPRSGSRSSVTFSAAEGGGKEGVLRSWGVGGYEIETFETAKSDGEYNQKRR